MKLNISLTDQVVQPFPISGKDSTIEDESCKFQEMKDEDILFSKEDNYLYVTLPTNSCQLKKEVFVYDIQGKLIKIEIFDGESNAFKIDVSEIKAFGIFVLVIQTGDNILAKKFIVNYNNYH